MNKRALILTVLLAFVFGLPAFAVETRTVDIRPSLTFAETTAECKVVIMGNSSSDDITAVIKFWENGRCLETWNEDATGILNFRTTVEVSKGNTYKLTVDAVIDGEEQPTAYIEKTHK